MGNIISMLPALIAPSRSTHYAYTCKIWMACELERKFLGGKYYTWFARELNPAGDGARPPNGESSNPALLYLALDTAVKRKDGNHSKIKDLRAGLLRVISRYVPDRNFGPHAAERDPPGSYRDVPSSVMALRLEEDRCRKNQGRPIHAWLGRTIHLRLGGWRVRCYCRLVSEVFVGQFGIAQGQVSQIFTKVDYLACVSPDAAEDQLFRLFYVLDRRSNFWF